MKKWLLLLVMTVILASVLSAATFKVAVLPLKRLDSASKYIQKFLTIRDLQYTFDKNDKFELMNMKVVAEAFEEMDIEDIDDMEKEDMAEAGKLLKADVVILGTIGAGGYNNKMQQVFNIQFRFYSMKTNDMTSFRVDVVKPKKDRWKTLDKDFMGKLTGFINEELDKMKNIAIQDYYAENYKQAEEGFNNVLLYNPEIKDAYFYMGLIAYQQKNYPQAITNLNKALSDSLVLADSKVLQNLANVYKDSGDRNMQINTLVKLANLQQDEELWLSVANLYVENNQNDKAREALEKSLALDPNFRKAQYRMAFLLFDMSNYNDAIPYLEKAADENPENDLIGRRLAFSYQKAGRISSAITRYEDMIKTNPNNNIAYLNLAGLYRTAAGEAAEQNNQPLVNEYNQKALNTLQRLQQIDSENALVYLRFADTYLAMNNTGEAEKNAQLALSKDARLYQPYVIMATINQRNGSTKYNQFIDYEKKAQETYGNTARRFAQLRDAARLEANTLFRKADEQLRAAKLRTTEPEVISDIDNKLSVLANLISQSAKMF